MKTTKNKEIRISITSHCFADGKTFAMNLIAECLKQNGYTVVCSDYGTPVKHFDCEGTNGRTVYLKIPLPKRITRK